MRRLVLAAALLAGSAAPAGAEWHLKPFFALTFAGDTSFVGVEQSAGGINPAFGFSGQLLGEIVGVEGDVGYGPGFFETGDLGLVTGSAVTTVTGNVVIALPRRLAEYTLRPYFVGGAGLMHVRIDYLADPFGPPTATLAAFDIGGGVTGFLSESVGLSWDVRRFSSFGGSERGGSFGPEQLSFWRASMAVAIRY